MAGKTVLITGASSGIGRAAAIGLAILGAQVVIVGRDAGRLREAAGEIRAAGGGPIAEYVADLSVQADVRYLTRDVLQDIPRIDVLLNNVGGYFHTRHATPDGLERTFALNHLAPFLLTNLLLDRLRRSAPARIVTVSSNAHRMAHIDFDDLQGERAYSGSRAYDRSKLANLLFTYELSRRLAGTGVTANAVHPGMVRTSFGADDPGRIQQMLVPLLRPFMKSPSKGAATSIHVASAANLKRTTGQYFVGGTPRRSSDRSYDVAAAKRLWTVSEDLVGPPLAPLSVTKQSAGN